MPFVHAPWWCLEIPPEWRAEEEQGEIVIVDPDDIGELCITVLRRDRDAAEAVQLADLGAELVAAGHASRAVELAGLRGDYFEYRSEGQAWREWFLAEGDALVMISYCCDEDDANIDAAVIDEILASFVLADNSELDQDAAPNTRD